MFAASKTASVSGGYQISRSLRFNSADSAYLNRTPASASNRRTFTLSVWVKRSFVGTGADNSLLDAYVDNSNRTQVTLGGTGNAQLYLNNVVSGSLLTNIGTAAVFRDPSAWYHIVYSVDTTQATSTNRVAIYVNGVAQTLSGTYPTLNEQFTINNNTQQTLGVAGFSGLTNYFSGYMTEVNFIDGQQLTPSSFGETNAQTGVWQPKAYAGTYGTNGFYLNFSDNSNTTAATLGKDYSGNGNNWTPNNFSVTAGVGNDSLVDSPTSYGTDTGVGGTVRGNYCTLNPLDNQLVLSNGNLQFNRSVATWVSSRASIGMTSGKWYWEVTATAATGTLYCMVGVSLNSCTLNDYFGVSSAGWGYSAHDGYKYNAGGLAYGSTWVVNDVIGIAFDADAGTITFYKNNVSQGTAYTGLTSGPYFPTVALNGTVTAYINFGQRPFAYTAPSGYKALCTQNLPTPTIGATTATQAGAYFNPVLYTGNGSTNSITGVGFSPDLVWIKSRSAAYNNRLYDQVRGVQNVLQSNSTAAEASDGTGLTAFGTNGFTLGSSLAQNENASTFVAWNWKANGSGSTNTAGSITSTVSANTTSGFSVVTYTSTGSVATVGHGLGVAPSMIIVKARGSTSDWFTYHVSMGATQGTYLNQSTYGGITSANFWNNTAPTSTVFTNGAGVVNPSATTVAYCFAEVAGYSKFGSYTGNGSADGPFVYTGFRPRFVMIKRSDAAGNWYIFDTTRNTINVISEYLFPNRSDAETTNANLIDIISNGFKLRSAVSGDWNASGGTYIFAAFAEAPQKFALAR